MKAIWSNDGAAVKIYGDYSPHPQIVLKEVVEHFGGIEEAFHRLCELRTLGFSPKTNYSESYPATMQDVEMAIENKERGGTRKERYWKFGTIYPTPHEFVRGYYYTDGKYAIFSGGTKILLPNI